MKKITAAVLIAAMMLTLAGCRSQERTTLYQSDSITVERQGRTTYILEAETGNTYTCKLTRSTNRTEARTAATGTNTDTISIKTVFNIIIVDVKATGETVYIRG